MKTIHFAVIALAAFLAVSCSSTSTPVFTPIIPPTITPSQTNPPTSTFTPTITLTPTPVYPVREGTPYPSSSQIISENNLGELIELARYGPGVITDWDTTQDFKYFARATNLGVQVYDLSDLHLLWERAGNIAKLAFSPDGDWLAVAQNTKHNLNQTSIELWRAQTGETLQTLGVDDTYKPHLVFSPSNQYLILINFTTPAEFAHKGTLSIFDISTASLLKKVENGVAAAFSSDSQQVAIGLADFQNNLVSIELRGLPGWELLHTFTPPSSPANSIYSLAFSPDNSLLASGGAEWITLWNIEDGKTQRSIKANAITNLNFTLDGTLIYGEGSVWMGAGVWSVGSGLPVQLPPPFYMWINLSRDGTIAILTGDSGWGIGPYISPLKAWDVKKRVFLDDLEPIPYLDTLYSAEGDPQAVISPDDSKLLIIANTGIRLWDLKSSRLINESLITTALMDEMLLFPSETNNFTAPLDKEGKVFSYTTAPLEQASGYVIQTNNGNLKIFQSGPNIALVDFNTERAMFSLKVATIPSSGANAEYSLYGAGVSPNGTVIYTTSDKELSLWNLASGEFIKALTKERFYLPTFSPDGTLLAAYVRSSDSSYAIHIWDTMDGRLLKIIKDQTNGGFISFSHDSRWLAIGGFENSAPLTIYRMDNGEIQDTYLGCSNAVFSKDDQIIFCASHQGTLQFWRAADHILLHEIPLETNTMSFTRGIGLNLLTLSKDGTQLAAQGEGVFLVFGIRP